MTTAPRLTRPAFHVWLAPADTDPNTVSEDQLDYHLVRIHHADQLRAELEGRRLGFGAAKDSPMHTTSLWLWAALVRQGIVDQRFMDYVDRCVAFDRADDDDTAEAVDPTAASTSSD